MDYILFYSNYSQACKSLLDEFPTLIQKSVKIDSLEIYTYVKKIHIESVPTLIVFINNKIIDRIIGSDDIKNWLLTLIYRTNSLQEVEQQPISQPQPPQQQYHEQQEEDTLTSLEDLELTDEKEPEENIPNDKYISSGVGGSSAIKLAEEMRREREKDEPMKKRLM